MDRRLSADEKKALKIKFARLIVEAFEGEISEQIHDEEIASWLDKLDLINQSRFRYLTELADYLYQGLRPGLVQKFEGETEPQEAEPTEQTAPEEQEQTDESEPIAPQHQVPASASPFPESLEIPHALVGKAYEHKIDLSSYFSGVLVRVECEGVDSVPGMEFSLSDLTIQGTPNEPGRHTLVLLLLREGEMNRDVIKISFLTLPNPDQLPALLVMPDGEVGDEYEAMVAIDRHFKYNFRLEGAESQGLDFDPDTMMLVGHPKEEGKFHFSLRFSWEGLKELEEGEVKIQLTIKPTATHYWQNLFPDPNSRFAKPLNESGTDKTQHGMLIGASRRGARHRHLGLHREDDFQLKYHSRLDWHIMVVADGHEEAPYARKGSELACKVAKQVINRRLDSYLREHDFEPLLEEGNEKALQAFLSHCLTTATYNAYLYIKRFADSESQPISDFHTSLQVAICKVMPRKGVFVAGMVIGPGGIAVYDHKKSKVELIKDNIPFDQEKTPHLLTESQISENTGILNKNLQYVFLPSFSLVSLISSGGREALFGDNAPISALPSDWGRYWKLWQKEVFHWEKNKGPADFLLAWLERQHDQQQAVEDQTLVMLANVQE